MGLDGFFLDSYCLLTAVALYFTPKTEYHANVKLRGDWIDHVGAFWLVACAFGPFFGWIVSEAFELTPGTWRWIYGTRVALAAGLPLLMMLPGTRYACGKSALIASAILVVVTTLPVLSAINSARFDRWTGPRNRSAGVERPHSSEAHGQVSAYELGHPVRCVYRVSDKQAKR